MEQLTGYERAIAESLRRQRLPRHEPRLVEAWMRLEHGALDALSPAQFDAEVRVAAECIEAEPAGSEELARSYGL